jgi:hypothetical protein
LAEQRVTLLLFLAFLSFAHDGEDSMSEMPSQSGVDNPHWPESKYSIGSPKFIHALGAVAANFNWLESTFACLFQLYSRLPPKVNATLFTRLTNDMRTSILSKCAESSCYSNDKVEFVLHFVQVFNFCKENRNILMHSRTHEAVMRRPHDGTSTLLMKKWGNIACIPYPLME